MTLRVNGRGDVMSERQLADWVAVEMEQIAEREQAYGYQAEMRDTLAAVKV